MMHRSPQTMDEYTERVRRLFDERLSEGKTISRRMHEAAEMFSMVDLSPVNDILKDRYAARKGRPSRAPSDMLRALLAGIFQRIPSIPALVKELKDNDLFAALAGFDSRDVPGVGTFYDFRDRLWNLDRPNLWHDPAKLKKPKPRVKAPPKKGDKADTPTEESVEEAIQRLFGIEFDLTKEAYGPLLKIFNTIFIMGSIDRNILDPDDLALSGDGTPVRTAARVRSRRICCCKENGIQDCTCLRYFSQPDANYGWDSHRKCYFFGYHAFFIVDSKADLPLFAMLNPASTHDSIGFCETFFRFRACQPFLHPSLITLDSAHDAMAIYRYLHNQGIKAFIDLNPGHSGKTTLRQVTLDQDGHPICPAGLAMKSNGTDRKLMFNKFRCPSMTSDEKGNPVCTCPSPCSEARYGRTFSFPMTDNLRHFNSPPRGSDEWKTVYNSRTSSERVNKRSKEDYLLERGHHRSTAMWYLRLFLTMMMIHLRAWYLHAHNAVA